MRKLVRDLIPKIILESGRVPITYIAESHEYRGLLKNKLLEEVEEFLQNENIEEFPTYWKCLKLSVILIISS